MWARNVSQDDPVPRTVGALLGSGALFEFIQRDGKAHDSPKNRVLVSTGVPSPTKTFDHMKGIHGHRQRACGSQCREARAYS